MEQRKRDDMHILNERMNSVEHETTVYPCKRAISNVDSSGEPPDTAIRNTGDIQTVSGRFVCCSMWMWNPCSVMCVKTGAVHSNIV